MLRHWTICLAAPEHLRYIPFDGGYPGSVKGEHCLRLGIDYKTEDEHIDRAREYALSVFPQATVTAIYETDIIDDGDKRQKAWPKGPTIEVAYNETSRFEPVTPDQIMLALSQYQRNQKKLHGWMKQASEGKVLLPAGTTVIALMLAGF